MKASLIGHDIEVVVLEVRGNIVRLGIKAPGEIAVVRSELLGEPANVVNDKEARDQTVLPAPTKRPTQIPTANSASDHVLHHFCERHGNWRIAEIAKILDLSTIGPEAKPDRVVGLG
jgi:carbon storage regulator CsrA